MKTTTILLPSLRLLTWTHATSAYTARVWTGFRGHVVGYEASEATSTPTTTPPVLLLNGFGVGSFHQHRLLDRLLLDDDGSKTVYALDYLGQGRSWPVACDDGRADCERGLTYSADTWLEQIVAFVEEVVLLPNHQQDDNKHDKVHLVGNSVGGYLATVLAFTRPDLVASVTLLNATPVWGLNLPGWSGTLPAPPLPHSVGRYLFDRIRDPQTIEVYLTAAYQNRGAFGEELMGQIRAATEGPGGHAAFASILWSPPAKALRDAIDFNSVLSQLECDVLLIFGKDDPWCTPAIAKNMHGALGRRQRSATAVQRYVELSNVGHCPNHEAPQAVAHLVTRWVESDNRDKLLLVSDDMAVVREAWADISMREVDIAESKQLGILDKIVTKMVG